MRKRARTDLCGGRSAMVVPTASIRPGREGTAILDPDGLQKIAGYLTKTDHLLLPLYA